MCKNTQLLEVKMAKTYQPLKFKRTFKEAIPPKAGNIYSAGIDLFIPKGRGILLPASKMVGIDTGIAFDMPEGYVGLIRPRGSALAKGLLINGTIDQDYRGSIRLFITNNSPDVCHLLEGRAYAQMILIKQDSDIYQHLEEVEELTPTERGDRMLGSTGNV